MLTKLKKALLVLLGAAVTGIGIHVSLVAGIGVDPLTMFEEGLAGTVGVQVGTATLIVNLTLLAIAFLVARKNVGWGSLITSFTMGPFINLTAATGIFKTPHALMGGIAMDILGLAMIGLGIAMYMVADFGVGASEAIMMLISEKFKITYAVIRIGMDFIWLIFGLILGGTWGLGTIFGVFGIGIFLDLWHRLLKKLLLQKNKEKS